MKEKVLVAMSGGVDSSVCAHLLKQEGYDVFGVVLKMTDAHEGTVAAAKQAAKEADVPLLVKEMKEEFEQKVISYFIDSYLSGATPNPCVYCNPLVKFKALLDTADEIGAPFLATGHYASLRREQGITYLCKGEEESRDQSYMLYRLKQDVLSRLLLPLSHLDKETVRSIAKQAGLSSFSAPDSQENCFIPENDYGAYIEQRRGTLPKGDMISPEGKVCGTHRGILHYTVGQRKHLGVALGRPVFVKRIDPAENRIYLGDLWEGEQKEIRIGDLSETFPGALSVLEERTVKIRSRAKAVSCTVVLERSEAVVSFSEPQRFPAKGQSAVIYAGDIVLGGGRIL